MKMNTLDRYVYCYSRLSNIKGINKYFLTPFRKIVRLLARKRIPQYFSNTPIVYHDRRSDLIVSLTSFPARINDVHLVINCILRQTILPKKIILWLSKEQFNEIQLPHELLMLQGDIFEIRFVDGDIRSHKKYYYVLNDYPNERILIVDDDLYYPTDMIERMLEEADKHPDFVICRYGSIAHFKEGEILPYKKWWYEVSDPCTDQNFFFGSGGGTILRKDMLYPDVLNLELALKLTPLADDVWLNAMVNLAGTHKSKIKFGLLLQTTDQTIRLTNENVGMDANSSQIQSVCNYYRQRGLNPFNDKSIS